MEALAQVIEIKHRELIDAAWEEVGYRLQPLKDRIFVKTDPPETMFGSIHLPASRVSFYSSFGNERDVKATVMAVGPKVRDVYPGDRICFQRLHFGHIKRLADLTYVGWVTEYGVHGHVVEE